MATDYYSVLGVDRSASKEDIKRAYRKLAHTYHPDKEGGNEEKFKEVNAAYQVLSDDAKRTQYDQYGSTFDDAGAGGFGGFNVNFEDIGLNDIFNQFFGGARSRRGPRVRRGDDVEVDATITFIESAQGLQRDIALRLYQTCSHCRGNGAEPGTPIKECPTCHGSGTVTSNRQTMFGVFAQSALCPTCRGEGKQADTVCTTCRGQGREMTQRPLRVEIPAGIADSQVIRLSGKGEAPPRGGTPGDLFVTIHVTPHPILHRDGDLVRSTVTIPFVDAVLGTQVNVETLAGKSDLTIAPGTQPGAELTLPRQGFPRLGGSSSSDHVVTVNVQIPRKLSRAQRTLLEKYREAKKPGLFA